jgi:hypothetical protein
MEKLTFGDFYTLVWSMVPQVWKDADDEYGKSLQILLYTMSQHMYYYFYNRVVHMEELFDPDRCPEKYLKFLSGMIGWKLIGSDPASWREQIKAAPLLYKIRGTNRGILLAEKLIGYSVFMSELYRDHVGDAVPKERIFNNTPASVKIKPWFRKTLNNIEGELLPGYAESDQFDSFNTTGFVKLDKLGQVIRPRILSSTRKLLFTSSSTTERYNNLTGKYSIARYAKLPRMNVVLKYDSDLGEENSDGSIRQNNFNGAIDLLLQFKPFHVHIDNLEVRYSLSEYVFDQANMADENLNVHEEFSAAVNLAMSRAENTITFSPNVAVELVDAITTNPASAIENRGVISSVYKVINLSTLTPSLEDSLYSIISKTLPIKSFIPNSEVTVLIPAIGDNIVSQAEYVDSLPITPPAPQPAHISIPAPTILVSPVNTNYYIGFESKGIQLTCISDTSTTDPAHPLTVSWYKDSMLFYIDNSYLNTISVLNLTSVDLIGSHTYVCEVSNSYGVATSSPAVVSGIEAPVHAILKYDLSHALTEPILDFKSMLSSQEAETTITESTTTPIDGYNKIISSAYSIGLDSSVITNILVAAEPFRSSVQTIYDIQNITSNPSRPWDLNELSTATVVANMTELNLFKQVYADSMVLILDLDLGPGATWNTRLEPGIDYYFDNKQTLFLNSASIAAKLDPAFTNFTFLYSFALHIIYLTRTTYKDETLVGIPGRGFRYKTRLNTKFSRQFLVNTLPPESLNRLMPTQVVSVDSKTKQKSILGIKQFKTPTNIYNRSSLKNENIDNYHVVNKDPLSRIDKSKWTVYSPEYTAYYLGDQKITNNWWGNYYQAKFPEVSPGVPAFVSYDSIDTSREAQAENVNSNQWMSALKLLNLSDPRQFLVTRKSDSVRTGLWKRNSCKFVSIPFIRSRRDSLQVFRRDAPTFTRSEESSDYPVDTSVPPRFDNYKYILADGTDVSLSYFTPGFSIPEKVSVTMDRSLGAKATLATTGYGLTFPDSDTYYNNYSSDISPQTYFNQTLNEYTIKSSLYAGNIPISRDPNQFTGITEFNDKLALSITGLEVIIDTFDVTGLTNNFVLSKSDLFVSWAEVNTGETVAFGYYSPYNVITFPNIQVSLNGFLLPYLDAWKLSLDRIKSVDILVPLESTDIVTVLYQVFPTGLTNSDTPPSPQNPYIQEITLIDTDITLIEQGNRYVFDLPTATQPCISWYSKVTNEYINSGSTPIEYQPFALFEDAEPNAVLKLNGFITKYKTDWTFLLKQENSVVTASIALSPLLSLSLSTNDTIRFEYFSTV